MVGGPDFENPYFRFASQIAGTFNTPSALRAGGFNRFAHSAGPGLKVEEMFLDERGEGKKREERRGKREERREKRVVTTSPG